jgi:DNA-binding winged helix-turn-helix (wHTH) protein/Tfp pilus assembly protein PilF
LLPLLAGADMSLKRKEIFEFGDFRLDVDEHTIERIDGTKNGVLPEKAFQTLVLLVRRRGHLVSKEELINFVWPDTIVEDNNLEKCIHHLRQFLGETSNGDKFKYIETVRKHGYRFVGRVRAVEVSFSWLPESFRNGDEQSKSEQAKFDDLNEEIFEPEKAVEGGPEITQKRRHRLGISLLSLATILALFGGYYFFIRPGVEANAVEVQSKRGTSSDEAHRFYLMAMNLSEERGVQNVVKSLEYLDQAVALDPNYAIAWAAKAHTHRDMVGHGDPDAKGHYEKSMEAIGKALAIDPNISNAYSALCHNKNRYEYDFSGAETACKRALELDPDSPVAHKTYANFLYTRGRFDEAIVEIKTAMDLQPVSYSNQQIYALTLYFARRYDEAAQQFKRLIELNPNHSYIHGRLILVLEEQGKEAEAFEYLVEMLTLQKTNPEKIERYKAAYRTAGWRGVQIERIKTAEAEAEPRYFQLACLYARIGDKDKAFEYLEKAFEQRSFQMAILSVEPQLDSLRNDPRFADLVRRVER